METVIAPDGRKYELAYTGKVAGPGSTGQNFGRNYLWFRVDDGKWQHCEMEQAHKARAAILEGRESELLA